MVFDELFAEIFKGALRNLQVDKKQRERKKRRELKKEKRIQELEGGENEYEARKSLRRLSGVGSKSAGKLYDAGYETHAQARSASIEELQEVDGIGKKLASDISREGEVKDLDLSEEIPYSHYGEAVGPVKQLKREKRHDEAEKILLWSVEQAENERRPPPWYFKQLAIIYRKENRYEDEVALMERYINTLQERNVDPEEVSSAAVKLVDRLDRARELAEESR